MPLVTDGTVGGVTVTPRSDPQKRFWKPLWDTTEFRGVIPS